VVVRLGAQHAQQAAVLHQMVEHPASQVMKIIFI
jgi:hypothetical protein